MLHWVDRTDSGTCSIAAHAAARHPFKFFVLAAGCLKCRCFSYYRDHELPVFRYFGSVPGDIRRMRRRDALPWWAPTSCSVTFLVIPAADLFVKLCLSRSSTINPAGPSGDASTN